MKFRNFVSLSLALSFAVLAFTGVLSFFTDYSRTVATVHTFFGLTFLLGALFHLSNNLWALLSYLPFGKGLKRPELWIVAVIISGLLGGTYFQKSPFTGMMDLGARYKAKTVKEIDNKRYAIIEMTNHAGVDIQFDLLHGEHFWHPQIAIWMEDSSGHFVQTLFVTKATAKGLFFGGRTKDNFKSFDEEKDWSGGDYRRVDALPIWSHKKGPAYTDGYFAPPSNEPLPDAITGATQIGNFILETSVPELSRFTLKLEINVAFDDNEYYSEYDFPEDDEYHSGTGLTGQPSLIYSVDINLNDRLDYYLMQLVGHGHHSGKTGKIYPDLSKITTARDIVERIVIGVTPKDLQVLN